MDIAYQPFQIMNLPAASCGVSKGNSPKPTRLSILRSPSSAVGCYGGWTGYCGGRALFKLRRVRPAIHARSKLQGILAKANKSNILFSRG